jgi:hypothetical protein
VEVDHVGRVAERGRFARDVGPTSGQVARLAARPLRVEREALRHRPREAEGAEVERVVAGLAARDRDQELLGVARERARVAVST